MKFYFVIIFICFGYTFSRPQGSSTPSVPQSSLTPLGPQGGQWGPSGPQGSQWSPPGPQSSPWSPLGPQGSQWSPPGSQGSQWIPFGPPQFAPPAWVSQWNWPSVSQWNPRDDWIQPSNLVASSPVQTQWAQLSLDSSWSPPLRDSSRDWKPPVDTKPDADELSVVSPVESSPDPVLKPGLPVVDTIIPAPVNLSQPVESKLSKWPVAETLPAVEKPLSDTNVPSQLSPVNPLSESVVGAVEPVPAVQLSAVGPNLEKPVQPAQPVGPNIEPLLSKWPLAEQLPAVIAKLADSVVATNNSSLKEFNPV